LVTILHFYPHQSAEPPFVSWPSQFSSNEKAVEFSSFFASRKKPEFERTLKQSLENVRVNARWIQGIRSETRLAQTVQELLRRP
jgi:puromycin-sensitive aminopeptidase